MFKEGVCKYWEDVPDEDGCCQAGVDIRKLAGTTADGWVRRLPCFRVHETDVKCDKYKEPTSEEIKAAQDHQKELEGYAYMALADIRDTTQLEQVSYGVTTCPRCGGTLVYEKEDKNITAKCSADGCLNIQVVEVENASQS